MTEPEIPIGHWCLEFDWSLRLGRSSSPYQIPYFFLRLHKVTSSMPRTFAASSIELVDERTARMCCSSICSRGTRSPTDTPKPEAGSCDGRGVRSKCSGPTRSPRHRIDARSTTLRSSRTFPGQPYVRSASRAGSDDDDVGLVLETLSERRAVGDGEAHGARHSSE